MLESELESEFVGLLEKIQQPDPTFEPGKQAEKARDVPVKLITGAHQGQSNKDKGQSKTEMGQVGLDFILSSFLIALSLVLCPLYFVRTLVRVFYAELRRKRGSPLPATAGQ